ncbi:hypothetical protein VCA_003007 [Vibrio albensis VL426]|nr:hypothetical protein VCA_003007 [Vibrio cholerae VL426]
MRIVESAGEPDGSLQKVTLREVYHHAAFLYLERT